MVALGRVVEHDERSRRFVARTAPGPLRKVTHRRYGPVLDQGSLGSCTGNAMAQSLNHVPLRLKGRVMDENVALTLYSRATALDAFPGIYPPEDTGSSGLAVAKAAKEAGYITAYTHAFGLDQLLSALMLAPCIVGTNWHDQMFSPNSRGFVRPEGPVVGGHEYACIGVDPKAGVLTFLNSWSAGWGDRGRFYMTFSDFGLLLADDGDATFPVR